MPHMLLPQTSPQEQSPAGRFFARLRHILEMIRFSHTLFALPFAFLSAVMAWRLRIGEQVPAGQGGLAQAGAPLWREALGILLCMVTARSAAMAFNRIADWRLDASNPRTAGRHIPQGLLSVGAVAVFAVCSAVGFIAATLLFLPNRLPLWLSVPVLAFLLGYSWTKRFTSLAHFWLGASLMLAPVAAWIALRGAEVMARPGDLLPALALGTAVLLWTAGFDMIYACQDVEYDREVGLHSIPARIGVAGALRLAAVCHAGMLGLLACVPIVYPAFGKIYWLAVAGVGALLVYEHSLVRPDDLARVNRAFFHVNAVVSLGLFALGTLDLFV
jgi:4-hydroxybenzoate polyprenyltransferase